MCDGGQLPSPGVLLFLLDFEFIPRHEGQEGRVVNHSDVLLVQVGKEPLLHVAGKGGHLVQVLHELADRYEPVLVFVQQLEAVHEGDVPLLQSLPEISDHRLRLLAGEPLPWVHIRPDFHLIDQRRLPLPFPFVLLRL